MSEADPREYLRDPLSAISRLERRNLLIASTVGLFVGHVGMVPTQVSALGLTFNGPAQNAFTILFILIILYMMVAFFVYAVADFFVWRKCYLDYQVASEQENSGWTLQDQDEANELGRSIPPIYWYWKYAPLVAWFRVFFDFVLPFIIGSCAVIILGIMLSDRGWWR